MKFFSLTAAVCWLAVGCQTTNTHPVLHGTEAESIRINSYSLLHQLMEDEKDVSLLRFIKREHADVKQLILRIAHASRDGGKLLEQMSKQDRSILLTDTALPPGEVKTRTAIAATKQKALLSKKSDDFELTLLLTQTEALTYGWHLAKVADAYEPDPEKARKLGELAKELEDLYQDVYLMVLNKTHGTVTK